ncbi:hypothetical protein QBC35DRAFT_409987 [Podospora australis]|uniref:Nucleoside phosphorylase domain-containing protein n=1 Tax=Podospora australis TaxID=1536484 RepID=A0AAN6WT09_9PEZI|nr:hypothetical protein QBC35DRAFT_409987 [Podospora australis]
MPYPIESSSWRLLQALGNHLGQKKARYQPLPFANSDLIQLDLDFFEVELRRVFLVRDGWRNFSPEDFALFQETLGRLCSFLESAVTNEIHPALDRLPYPRLRGLVAFLENSDDELFDLISGPNQSLFQLSTEPHKIRDNLDTVTECNNVLGRLLQSPKESTFRPPPKEKKRPWKDPTKRNHVISVLDGLFQQFRCGKGHELVMDVSEDVDKDENLRLVLSCCAPGHCHDHDAWQPVQYSSLTRCLNTPNIAQIPDICDELNRSGGQGIDLTLLVERNHLFGAWSGTTKNPSSRVPKETLEGLVTKGAFEPALTYETFKSQGPTAPRFTPVEMRKLAVKLGYCLMDFFDANIGSQSIRFMSSQTGIEKERIHLAFNSSLPATEDLHTFHIGHPTLLSFAKLLLEIYSGSGIIAESISPYYGENNQKVWLALCVYLERLENERSDSYLRAIRGCLMVHRKISKSLSSSPSSIEDDAIIRKALYKEIVRNLELGLDEATPRAHHKRRRSESPPPLSERGNGLERARITAKASSFAGRSRQAMPEHKKHRSSGSQSFESDASGPTFLPTIAASPLLMREDSPVFSPRSSTPSVTGAGVTDHRPQSRHDFEVAIICALEREAEAVLHQFDCFWDDDGDTYGKAHRDPNEYRTGRIGKDDVVLLVLSGMGKVSAASAVSALLSSYTGIRLALVVGICGGVPQPNRHDEDDELVLGDIVISNAVIQFDFGRRYPNRSFHIKSAIQDSLAKAERDVQALLGSLGTSQGRSRLENRTAEFLEALQETETNAARQRGPRSTPKYTYPGAARDRLFPPTYLHKHRDSPACGCGDSTACDGVASTSCRDAGCDDRQLLTRDPIIFKQALEKGNIRLAQRPSVHIGAIASGDTVMKSAEDRDSIARQHKVIAFEMEGAGIWDAPHTSCLVIKSVCDYADSHKNKDWQNFAAATAASAMKALLSLRTRPERECRLPPAPSPRPVRSEPTFQSRQAAPVLSPGSSPLGLARESLRHFPVFQPAAPNLSEHPQSNRI